MIYDFDTVVDRKDVFGTIKWNPEYFSTTHPDPIPMWIADMDIPTPDFILDALRKRLDHPFLGYVDIMDDYYASILRWQEERFGIHGLKRENIMYHANLMGALDVAIEAFTEPGDYILLHEPAYHMFRMRIASHKSRNICPTLLRKVNGRYEMDYDDIEKKIVENHVKLAVLCSPHNPTGRCWTREEMEQFVEICYRHHVIIVADEIHSDLVLNKEAYISIMNVSRYAREISISLRAPGKTFNTAGQASAYSTIFNSEIRKKIQEQQKQSHYNYHNIMSVETSIAAYTYGAEWVDQLLDYIRRNAQYIADSFQERCPSIKASIPEATYFMWLDFSDTGLEQDEIKDRCFNQAGVILYDGNVFGGGGQGHMRCNIGCQRCYIVEAVDRLCKVF